MTFIIHGASGAQGAPIFNALRAAGRQVTAAVRMAAAFTGGDAISVDFGSVASLVRAYRGADGVFVHLPVETADQQRSYAGNIVAAVHEARPARVIASTSGYKIDGSMAAEDAMSVLAAGLADSGVSSAMVEPRLFLENLLLPTVLAPTRAEGVLRYPIREDYAVSWSSHLDVADVVVRLFAAPEVVGSVSVGALPGLVGADLAEGFSRYLDRPVGFESQTPDEFSALITPMFGSAAAEPVVDSYRHRLAKADELISQDRSAQAVLGLEPLSVEQWLRAIRA